MPAAACQYLKKTESANRIISRSFRQRLSKTKPDHPTGEMVRENQLAVIRGSGILFFPFTGGLFHDLLSNI